MEESLRSGGVVKKKTSSGCLIIKKKVDVLGGGGGILPMDKKRSSMPMREFGFSRGSLDPGRAKHDDTMLDESGVYRNRVVEDHEYRRNRGDIQSDRKRNRVVENDEYRDFGGKNMRNDYMEIVRKSSSSRDFVGGPIREMMVEKREHSNFDNSNSGMRWRDKAVDVGEKRRYAMDEGEAHLPVPLSRLKYDEETAQPIRIQGKNGVLKVMVNKKKRMDLFSTSKYDSQVVQNRKGFKSEVDLFSTSKYDGHVVQNRKGSNPERDLFSTSKYDGQEVQNRKGFKSNEVHEEKTPIPTPFYLDPKRAYKRGLIVKSEKSQLKLEKPMLEKHKKAGNCEEKIKLELQKSPVRKSNRAGDYESNGTDTSLKLAPPSLACSGSMKAVKREEPLPAQNVTPIKDREEKSTPPAEDKIQAKCKKDIPKNGGSTEKQLLRERIREMLLKSGWTIDYRPRRNRDYLDAVYINPNGTAYWSIIKAYEALQKQDIQKLDAGVENQLDRVSGSFAPLSDSLINKLTRQTKKKIEKEMRKKSGHDSLTKYSEKAVSKVSFEGSDDEQQEERHSSFIRQNYKAKKVNVHGVDNSNRDDLSVHSMGGKHDVDITRRPSTTNSSVVQARKSRKISQYTLLVRTSAELSESHGYVPYMGKRTLLAWLIDSGMVQLSEKVQFINRRRSLVKLEGWITREGIHCGCCSKILTVSKFELHAGSKLHQPFQNIILESGPSLLQCLIDAWNEQEESSFQDFNIVGADGDDPDDDTCGICGDGGDLICCDGCPSTFHLSCLGLQILPPGDWHCPNCTCKFCGSAGGNVLEENGESSSELAMCNLCEQKYHKACSNRIADPLDYSGPLIFCGKNCQEIHDYLQKILWVKHELESGFSWSLIRRTDLDCDAADHEYPQRVEGNAKLAVALSAMNECFVPFMDRRSGINLIRNVFYSCGSNYSRLNFRGFYAIVLERGDEIISAASIRFRGAQLAEMPYIGTRRMYRRQGMCRRLLSAIESVLGSLKIEKLIIPAIGEHMDTWTTTFGFKELEESLRTEMKLLNLLVFPRIDWLQKQLLKQEILVGADVKRTESNDNSPPVAVSPESSNMDPTRKEETNNNMQDDIDSNRMSKISYEADVIVHVASESPVSQKDKTVFHALNCTEIADVSHLLEEENKCLNAQIMKGFAESSDRLNCHSSSDTAVETLQTIISVSFHQIKDDCQSSAEDLTGVNIDANSLQIRDGKNVTSVAESSERLKCHSTSDIAVESLQTKTSVSCQPLAEDLTGVHIDANSLQIRDGKNVIAKSSDRLKCHSSSDTVVETLQTKTSVSCHQIKDDCQTLAEDLTGVNIDANSLQIWYGKNVTAEYSDRLKCHSSSDTAVETLQTKTSVSCHQIKDDCQSLAEDLTGVNIDASYLQIRDGKNVTSVAESSDRLKCHSSSDTAVETLQTKTSVSCHQIKDDCQFSAEDLTGVNIDAISLQIRDGKSGTSVAESSGLKCHSSSDTAVETLQTKTSVSCHQIKDDCQSLAEDLTGVNIDANYLQIRDGKNVTSVELQTNLHAALEVSNHNSFQPLDGEKFTSVELQTSFQVPSEASHSNSFRQDGEKFTLFERPSNLQMSPEASHDSVVLQNQGDGCSSAKIYIDAFPEAIEESTCMEHSPDPIMGTPLQNATDQTCMQFGCVSTTCVDEDPVIQFSSVNQGNAVNEEVGIEKFSSTTGASTRAKVDIVHSIQVSSAVDFVADSDKSEGRVCYSLTATDFLEEASNQNIEGDSFKTRGGENIPLVELQTLLQVPLEASHESFFQPRDEEKFSLVALQTHLQVPSEDSHNNSFQQDGEKFALVELQSNLQMPPENSHDSGVLQNPGDEFYNDAFSKAIEESTRTGHSPGPIMETSMQNMQLGCVSTSCVGEDPIIHFSSVFNQGNAVNGSQISSAVDDVIDESDASEERVSYSITAADFLVEASTQNLEDNSFINRDGDNLTSVELQTQLQVPSEASHEISFQTRDEENFSIVELQTNMQLQVPFQTRDEENFTLDPLADAFRGL